MIVVFPGLCLHLLQSQIHNHKSLSPFLFYFVFGIHLPRKETACAWVHALQCWLDHESYPAVTNSNVSWTNNMPEMETMVAGIRYGETHVSDWSCLLLENWEVWRHLHARPLELTQVSEAVKMSKSCAVLSEDSRWVSSQPRHELPRQVSGWSWNGWPPRVNGMCQRVGR